MAGRCVGRGTHRPARGDPAPEIGGTSASGPEVSVGLEAVEGFEDSALDLRRRLDRRVLCGGSQRIVGIGRFAKTMPAASFSLLSLGFDVGFQLPDREGTFATSGVLGAVGLPAHRDDEEGSSGGYCDDDWEHGDHSDDLSVMIAVGDVSLSSKEISSSAVAAAAKSSASRRPAPTWKARSSSSHWVRRNRTARPASSGPIAWPLRLGRVEAKGTFASFYGAKVPFARNHRRLTCCDAMCFRVAVAAGRPQPAQLRVVGRQLLPAQRQHRHAGRITAARPGIPARVPPTFRRNPVKRMHRQARLPNCLQ